jgi:hypothetical protein
VSGEVAWPTALGVLAFYIACRLAEDYLIRRLDKS